jgi:hypothetical protein
VATPAAATVAAPRGHGQSGGGGGGGGGGGATVFSRDDEPMTAATAALLPKRRLALRRKAAAAALRDAPLAAVEEEEEKDQRLLATVSFFCTPRRLQRWSLGRANKEKEDSSPRSGLNLQENRLESAQRGDNSFSSFFLSMAPPRNSFVNSIDNSICHPDLRVFSNGGRRLWRRR